MKQEDINQYFYDCTLNEAEILLAKSGFATERYQPDLIAYEKRRGTLRLVLAEKQLRAIVSDATGQVIGSVNCRFTLRETPEMPLDVEGLIYGDTP